MLRRSTRWAVAVAVVVGSGWGAAAAAGDASGVPQVQGVALGFDGKYKVGAWVPAWVTLRGAEGDARGRLELTSPDGDEVPATYAADDAAEVLVPAGQDISALRYLRLGRRRSPVTVRFRAADGGAVSRTFAPEEYPTPLAANVDLIVTLGPSLGVEDTIKKRLRERSERLAHSRLEQADRLPRHWCGYEGVHTVMAATSQPGVLEQLDDQQFAALERWVQLGGRLMLCVGARGEEVFGPRSRWARFAPGRRATAVALHTTSGLENYASATERVDSVGGRRVQRFSVAATQLSEIRGLVTCSEIGTPEGRLPTIVRNPYGLGQVVFVAFDLDRPPFDHWAGRPGVIAKLLYEETPGRHAEAGQGTRLSQVVHVGYEDLTGQLRGALDQFVGVTRVEFSWVAGLVAIYVLLIGPVDYWVLRRCRRLSWTWLTFPAVVVSFCVLAGVLVHQWSGRHVLVNQVDVVDVDLDSAVVRGTTWAHLYSPAARAFALAIEPRLPLPGAGAGRSQSLLAWQGLPGQGLGGLSAVSTAALFSEPYRISSPADAAAEGTGRIDRMPIQTSGSKSLVARWYVADVPKLRGAQRLAADKNGLLTGTVVNPLGVELSDCLLMYQSWVYPLTGALAPGATFSVDGQSPRNLEWRLTRRRVVDTKDVGTPWDKTSFDVPRILEMMMFHRAAGGELYTGLTHAYQPYLDLTEHLRAGRAVLVGRNQQTVGQLSSSGQALAEPGSQSWTFYRIVIPVDQPQGPY